jgi:hypothetical protein
METAIRINPFCSDHFVWMDFGINHVAKSPETIHSWIHQIPDKIRQLSINPFCESIDPKQYFTNVWHNIAGGLFTGSKENLLKYVELFKEKTKQIYEEGWYQMDEAIVTIISRENPQLFDLYYGDYEGIIANYLKPEENLNAGSYLYNMNIILEQSKKLVHFGEFKEAANILDFCHSYFIRHIQDPLLYHYLAQHFILDYYYNDHKIQEKVIELIQLTRLYGFEEQTNQFLQENMNNINFYENKQHILSML